MNKHHKTWAEHLAALGLSDAAADRMKADRERELREYWQAVAAKVTTAEDVALLLQALLVRADELGLEVRAIPKGVNGGEC